jgi:hypothetical protein
MRSNLVQFENYRSLLAQSDSPFTQTFFRLITYQRQTKRAKSAGFNKHLCFHTRLKM